MWIIPGAPSIFQIWTAQSISDAVRWLWWWIVVGFTLVLTGIGLWIIQ